MFTTTPRVRPSFFQYRIVWRARDSGLTRLDLAVSQSQDKARAMREGTGEDSDGIKSL
jgi:hypothetical protein